MPMHFRRLSFFECMNIQFFNLLTCDLREAMPRQRSLTLFSSSRQRSLILFSHPLFFAITSCHWHSTPASQAPWRASTGSELYRNTWWLFLFFNTPFSPFLYRERYRFEGAFFTPRCFLPYAPYTWGSGGFPQGW